MFESSSEVSDSAIGTSAENPTNISAGGAATSRTEASEPVQSVQARDLVRLGESRIVEHRVAKVLDRAAEREHCLSDVDDLGRVLADRVDAEQLQALRVEQNLQQPHLRPEHL